MVSVRLVAFLAVQAACLMAVFAYALFGPSPWLLAGTSILSLAVLWRLRKTQDVVLMFSCLLLAATAWPLLLAYSAGRPLLLMTSVRAYFHDSEIVGAATFVVLLQLAALGSTGFISPARAGELVEGKPVGWRFRLVSFLVLIGLSILSNPTQLIFGGGYGQEGFRGDSFLIGGWPLLFVLCFAYYTIRTNLAKRVDVFLVLVLLAYWLAHGNRSEVFGVLLVLSIRYLNRGQPRAWLVQNVRSYFSGRRAKRIAIAVAVVVIGAGLFQYVGLVRGGEHPNAVQQRTEFRLSTIGPSAYTLAATIGMVEGGELQYQYGATYLDYLKRTFPSRWDLGFQRPEDLAELVKRRAQSIGGLHFGGEPYLNFGAFGAYLFALLFGIAIAYVARRSAGSRFYQVVALILLIYAPRIIWYGNIYLYKIVLLLIALRMLLILLKINVTTSKRTGAYNS